MKPELLVLFCACCVMLLAGSFMLLVITLGVSN